MTNSEIDEKIAKLEKAISSPATPESQKEQFRAIIKKLQDAKTNDSEKEGDKPAKSDEVLEKLFDLGHESPKEAKLIWDTYSEASKAAFKDWCDRHDAANENIYQGFIYMLKHAEKSGSKKSSYKKKDISSNNSEMENKSDKALATGISNFKKLIKNYSATLTALQSSKNNKVKGKFYSPNDIRHMENKVPELKELLVEYEAEQAKRKTEKQTSDKKTPPKRVKTGPEDVKVKKVPVKFKAGEEVHVKSLMDSGIVESSSFDSELKQNRYTVKFKEGGKESVLEPDLRREKVKKERSTTEKPTAPKKDPYDCEDLIATEKARQRKLKEAAKERADAPKHTPATKNKLAIEKVGERVVSNVHKRIEKGEVKRPELERLIKTTEEVLNSLRAALKKL